MSQVIDARVLRDVMARYAEALRAHREEIDSLNVFPVPDGDTGTNMLLTQEAVEEALEPCRPTTSGPWVKPSRGRR